MVLTSLYKRILGDARVLARGGSSPVTNPDETAAIIDEIRRKSAKFVEISPFVVLVYAPGPEPPGVSSVRSASYIIS